MRASDVIIVGAGVIGCAIGHHLARRGAKVRIFDGRTIAGGATQASAGVLAPLIEGDDQDALRDLGLRSLALYDSFVETAAEDSGIAVEYRRCGTLQVVTDAADADRLRQRANADGLEWMDAPAARSFEPALSQSVVGALFIPRHGYVAAGALTEALAWGAVRHGAQLETGHQVTAVRSSNDGASVITQDGTTWSAADVIMCAGSWLSHIDVRHRPARGTIKPVRGQLLRLSWQGHPPGRVIWGANCYAVPWITGLLLVGATVEDVGFDERTTAAGVRDLLDAVCDMLPDAWRATFVEARAGLRPATADGLPLIGRSPSDPHIIYATGHYRNGVLLAPLTAQIVTDLVIDGVEDNSLQLLGPG